MFPLIGHMHSGHLYVCIATPTATITVLLQIFLLVRLHDYCYSDYYNWKYQICPKVPWELIDFHICVQVNIYKRAAGAHYA